MARQTPPDFVAGDIQNSRPTDSFAVFRSHFLGAKQSIYMDVAARGLISTSVREAIDAYLDHRMVQGADKSWMFDEVEKTRESFARLIRADPTEIAFTKNVSDGINAFASAIQWDQGDNVVICEALEHPANVYPWYNLKELLGIQLKRVKIVPRIHICWMLKRFTNHHIVTLVP